MCHTENCNHELSQEEIEQLSPEEYSTYLAFGESMKPELSQEEEYAYARHLSQRIFDL